MSENVSTFIAEVVNELKGTVLTLQATVAEIKNALEGRQRDWFSSEEVAQMLGKSAYTVREWCRLGRIHADKRATGRGRSTEWMISKSELQRIRDEGLLPDPAQYRHVR